MEPINVTNRPIIVNQPMTAGIQSLAIDISDIVNGAVQFIWTGTAPVGTVNVLLSNDGINFDPAGVAAARSVSGNIGNIVIPFSLAGYKYIQAVFVFSSGTGTLNAIFNGKRN